MQIYLREQINKFFTLKRKEQGYEGLNVLPIFGDKAVYIPMNKIRAKFHEDTWSDQEEDWDSDVVEDGVVLHLRNPTEPEVEKLEKYSLISVNRRRLDLRLAFRSLPVGGDIGSVRMVRKL